MLSIGTKYAYLYLDYLLKMLNFAEKEMAMDTPARLLHVIDEEDIRQSPEKFFMLDQCGFFICTDGSASVSLIRAI